MKGKKELLDMDSVCFFLRKTVLDWYNACRQRGPALSMHIVNFPSRRPPIQCKHTCIWLISTCFFISTIYLHWGIRAFFFRKNLCKTGDHADWNHAKRRPHISKQNCFETQIFLFAPSNTVFSAFPKLYIPSTLNTDYLLWHTQLIVCAVKN